MPAFILYKYSEKYLNISCVNPKNKVIENSTDVTPLHRTEDPYVSCSLHKQTGILKNSTVIPGFCSRLSETHRESLHKKQTEGLAKGVSVSSGEDYFNCIHSVIVTDVL